MWVILVTSHGHCYCSGSGYAVLMHLSVSLLFRHFHVLFFCSPALSSGITAGTIQDIPWDYSVLCILCAALVLSWWFFWIIFSILLNIANLLILLLAYFVPSSVIIPGIWTGLWISSSWLCCHLSLNLCMWLGMDLWNNCCMLHTKLLGQRLRSGPDYGVKIAR